jgi:hypothetical protein
MHIFVAKVNSMDLHQLSPALDIQNYCYLAVMPILLIALPANRRLGIARLLKVCRPLFVADSALRLIATLAHWTSPQQPTTWTQNNARDQVHLQALELQFYSTGQCVMARH